MFCDYYLVKNYDITNNSTIIEAREKKKVVFGNFVILEKFRCQYYIIYKQTNFTKIILATDF